MFLIRAHCVFLSRLVFGPCGSKTCVRVSDKVRLKPVSSATETSKNIDILLVASLDMILSSKEITKLFANP